MSAWVTEKMAGHCGARLSGVSLSNATNSDLEKMRSALFAHGVIVMPGQNLTPNDHIRLAEFFGDIDVNRFFYARFRLSGNSRSPYFSRSKRSHWWNLAHGPLL
ncbi:TauD/TfdA family dioxygenase [Paracoccaceae bacterium]|nr:TauD/TfdA family dioxygenase [Paracoccaceae bacterium]